MPPAPYQVHTLETEFQAAPTQVRVLPPDRLKKERRYPVVYVLPVEPGNSDVFGDGLAEILACNLHNVRSFFALAPTFSFWPWYADHPESLLLRQESYFVKAVAPWVEDRYPVLREPRGRLLMGFSKSGFGAFSLLLRHPDLFGRAVAWDGVFGLDCPHHPGVIEVFGDQKNFDQYRPANLLAQSDAELRSASRLGLHGYGEFREDHQALHQRLVDLAIPHDYRDGPKRPHRWDSGWLPAAVEWLTTA